jgi:hypothetical protein
MPNAHVAAAAEGLPTPDTDQLITAAGNLARLLDVIVGELCGVTRDRDGSPEDAGALDRAEALAVIGRDFADTLIARSEARTASAKAA